MNNNRLYSQRSIESHISNNKFFHCGAFQKLANEKRDLELLEAIQRSPKNSFAQSDILDGLSLAGFNSEYLEAIFENSPTIQVSSECIENALKMELYPEIVLTLLLKYSDRKTVEMSTIITAIEKGYANEERNKSGGTRSILYLMMKKASIEDQEKIFQQYCLEKNKEVVQFCLSNLPSLIETISDNPLFSQCESGKLWIWKCFIEINKSKDLYNQIDDRHDKVLSSFAKTHNNCFKCDLIARQVSAVYNGKKDALSSLIQGSENSNKIRNFLNPLVSRKRLKIEEDHCLQMLVKYNKESDIDLLQFFLKHISTNDLSSLFSRSMKLAVSSRRLELIVLRILEIEKQTTTFQQLEWAIETFQEKPEFIKRIIHKLQPDNINLELIEFFKKNNCDLYAYESLLLRLKPGTIVYKELNRIIEEKKLVLNK